MPIFSNSIPKIESLPYATFPRYSHPCFRLPGQLVLLVGGVILLITTLPRSFFAVPLRFILMAFFLDVRSVFFSKYHCTE